MSRGSLSDSRNIEKDFKIMTDKEINEAVARGLGWVRCNIKAQGNAGLPPFQEPGWIKDGYGATITLPDYCHDIAAAWELIPKFEKWSMCSSEATIDTKEVCK